MNGSASITESRTIDLFSSGEPFRFECGGTMASVSVAYETYGTLNAEGTNAVLVCHALTGNAHAAGFSNDNPRSAGWWEPFIGPGRGIDTDRYFVVCSNILGSCYGTSGPGSKNPATGRPYALSFPTVTVRDMVRLQRALLEHLGVRSLATVVGGSLGGMQALEWAVSYPGFIRSVIPIATAAQHSAWCIGLDDIGRQAIMNDPAWRNGEYDEYGQPEAGLSLARQVAMVSYRSGESFHQRFGRVEVHAPGDDRSFSSLLQRRFQVESYLRYQGEKLVRRFDANSYLYITRAMDLHDVGDGRGTWHEALGAVEIPALCIGIDTDILYPAAEQRAIAAALPRSRYREIHSIHGHDAFLIEFDQLNGFVDEFLTEVLS